MKRTVVLYGTVSEDNFGFPSLMHGAEQLIHEQNPETEIVFYQRTPPQDIAVKDMGFPCLQMPYRSIKELLLDAVFVKLGKKPKELQKQEFFDTLRRADVVADLYGICFCDKFTKEAEQREAYSRFRAKKNVMASFPVCAAARILGKKIVKCPASYGTIRYDKDRKEARYAADKFFDLMAAREKESRRQMTEEAKASAEVLLSPDLANYFKVSVPEARKKTIGISVSHQIVRQWSSQESYYDNICALVRHILGTMDADVLLIPNETSPAAPVNDITVAQKIVSMLGETERVLLPDVRQMTSTQLKQLIAGCEVMVASRYHSCVASLSSGVPLLAIGWHYKYTELLELYKQEKWILHKGSCSSTALISLFDQLWENRVQVGREIQENSEQVRASLREVGKKLFF